MEITRQPAITISPLAEIAASGSSERSPGGPVAAISVTAPVKPGLERIQQFFAELA